MPARYAPLPNPHSDPDAIDEMEAAFDDSDGEDDDDRPLNTNRNGYHSLPNAEPPSTNSQHVPGTYDFENTDYDYTRPPPGSPPGPSSHALPNPFGNSNGVVPSFDHLDTTASTSRGGGWFRRTAAAVLPTHYVHRLGLDSQVPRGAIGGGTSNDGVFANVAAKPSRGIRVQDGDDIMIVPEEVQKEVPPTYAQAQADAVPPYWENTIHAPSSANLPGEVIVDGLASGSVFSFLWNLLVSISFQFVGFLLTYLLHTTHAAKFGSRAGLGMTLIQYGFAMRDRESNDVAEANAYNFAAGTYNQDINVTTSTPSSPTPTLSDSLLNTETATDWLSFLLMTIGWFLVLTSFLGFWRVKRWERGLLASQEASTETVGSGAIVHSIERMFGLHGLADGSLIRAGLGFPGAAHREQHNDDEVGGLDPRVPERNSYLIPLDPSDPDRTDRLARAIADEARLHQDLRSAGLL